MTDEIAIRRYGLLAPLDWGEDCDEQLHRMTALWNRLVEIEREHRAAYLAATAADPAVAAAKARRRRVVAATAMGSRAIRSTRPTPVHSRSVRHRSPN